MNNFQRVRASRILLALATLVLVAGCTAESNEPAIPKGAKFESWVNNGAGGRYVLNVVKGQVPSATRTGMSARVLTDSNCAPDASNINHCHNIIRFSNGDRIEVVNNHRMAWHRCLRPGETVRVAAMEGPWIELHTES
jgi:hypothetical protein